MAKIGRNEPCPCRSGKKFKHCCGLKVAEKQVPLTPEQALKITLMGGVEDVQLAAENKKVVQKELGVFYFYSTAAGDAWLLEMTECDCVQLARGGERLEPPIDENPETIEINWSHTFAIQDKQFEMTAYADKVVSVLADAPSHEISAAVRRIRKKFTASELQQVHVTQPSE
ncbi:SEC-C metal-binding domain-containing protein [Desulfotalea psychrophila]|uniref:Preprotein translocase subunit SecA n=1 Tax=Desulfotalea psychrophila (strain LSv54 / DSM 12343) TaxID=177439 RepID=Q6AJC5_DESPS|nr:SEC-C metal-binding domain-containing protein [Desulfotalea psychrophila]CAG37555.1 hypothetical protein DP2826 [Desulfotalea psychrophila LSv54]